MKSMVSIAVLFLFSISVNAQRTLIVDNNPGATAGALKFLNLENAIEAAQAGDVILLTPSTNGYIWPNSNETVRDKKNYTVKGAGLNTDIENNLERRRSVITNKAEIGLLQAEVPEFVTFDGIVFEQGLLIAQANSMMFKNCTFYNRLELAAVQHTRFENNIMLLEGAGVQIREDISSNFVGLTYRNNIIYVGDHEAKLSYGLFEHNLIMGNSASGNVLEGVENIFRANIIHGFTTTNGMIHSVFEYNTYEVTLGQNDGSSGEGNKVRTFTIPSIMDDSNVTANKWNRRWEVTSSSTDIVNQAKDGSNIGPTGGDNPFQKIFYSVPTITYLDLPTLIKLGEDPNATIIAKDN